MHVSQLHYLLHPLPHFIIPAVLLGALAVLLQLGILQYAYARLGMPPRTAMLVLLASLLGSYINVPIAPLSGQEMMWGREIDYVRMGYVVPVIVDWPGTIVAVNIGGALIPSVISLFLLARSRLWGRGLLATAAVAFICHKLAQPVPGLGIEIPLLVPAIAAGLTALLLSRQHAAHLAYVSGSLGTLIGADLLNLDHMSGIGAPVMSIGGAGTFDGIFVTGILAVLIASVSWSVRSSRRGNRQDLVAPSK